MIHSAVTSFICQIIVITLCLCSHTLKQAKETTTEQLTSRISNDNGVPQLSGLT